MDASVVSDILRDAVGVAIKLGGPMLVLSMLVGEIGRASGRERVSA